MEGRRIDGLPADPEGFLAVDEHCRVVGAQNVYAAGGRHLLPGQAGRHRDPAGRRRRGSDRRRGRLRGRACPFDPVLRGVLWTGDEPRYLYGRPSGGHGEVSKLSEAPPWSERDGKIVGRYLTPFLAASLDRSERLLASN
jgi:hypothetical protein